MEPSQKTGQQDLCHNLDSVVNPAVGNAAAVPLSLEPVKNDASALSENTMVVDREDEDEEDDVASELSQGDDLRQDLEGALNDSNFSFTGNFYHASILATPPNPCLSISGLGFLGLPLSERDAKAIVSVATLSPFGHGERTVVDQDVRDTWEIEPDRIAFGNPEWSKYIDGVICKEVCKALGVAIGSPPPKMELYKLLLYETGSHFLPHQDTQKANGMFATVVIILPSAYTGGQVVVSHASTTKSIDYASNSLLSTAVLAWYTDVKHEVKSVTSGYRLVLTYNLIHVAPPGIPGPTLPQMGKSVDRLTKVLTKWRGDKYAETPETPLLAYVLRHEYSAQNLRDGFKALKGGDAHLVTSLRGIAEGLGYIVGLATLERHVSGPGDDCGGGYYRRRRRHYSSSEDEDDIEDTPGMIEVSEETTSITGLVDLTGVLLFPSGEISLEEGNLIPSDPFEDKSPDKVEYEGYMGNGAGDVTHWYHRTVLVLMHEDEIDGVCSSDAGISYAFQKLIALCSDSPISLSTNMKPWVERIVSKSGQLKKGQALKMLDLAMNWKDPDVFKTIMKSPVCTLSVVDVDVLLKAWKMFSFEEVRSSLEQALARSAGFSEKMKLIYTVRSELANEDDVVGSWCKIQIDRVLASYTQLDVRDIPGIMSAIRQSGWFPFANILFPTVLQQTNSYVFLIALVKALQEARQLLLDQLAKTKAISNDFSTETTPAEVSVTELDVAIASQGDGKNPVDTVIEKALEAAAKQWSQAPASSASRFYVYHSTSQDTQTGKLQRIVEIVDQAIVSNNLEICRSLFIDMLKNTGTVAEKFAQTYEPLISRLRDLLQTKNLSLCAPPFVDLFQILIGSYLRVVLGKRGQHLNTRLRKIGCGCQACQPLDKFILDPTTRTTLFRLAQKRRAHLEGRIANASDLCTYETIRSGSPYGVKVTKRPEVVLASTWDHRQNAGRAFLSSIGTDEVIKKIMGVRYADVVAAINGTTPFGATKVQGDGSLAPVTTTQKATAHYPAVASSSHPGSSSSGLPSCITKPNANPTSTQAAPALASNAAPQVAGKKRKDNPAVNLGFIDLT